MIVLPCLLPQHSIDDNSEPCERKIREERDGESEWGAQTEWRRVMDREMNKACEESREDEV